MTLTLHALEDLKVLTGEPAKSESENGWVTVQYWPKDKPIPEGWEHVKGVLEPTHHGFYSILIRRIEE